MNLIGTSPRWAAAGKALRSIRSATANDLKAVIAIHEKVFVDAFLTNLGSGFLSRYYSLILDYPGGLFLVSEREDQVRAFVSGFVDPTNFYVRMKQQKIHFAIPVLSALIRRPSLAGRVMSGMRRVNRPPGDESRRSCELSSLAVMPQERGKGTGRALVDGFLERASSGGAQYVFLSTDRDENEPANALYRKAGFRLSRRYRQHKQRWMNEYVINVSPGDL